MKKIKKLLNNRCQTQLHKQESYQFKMMELILINISKFQLMLLFHFIKN